MKYKNCPKCKSFEIIKRGNRNNKIRGEIQRYGCKKCGKRFSEKGKTYRMRNKRWKINMALKLRKEGISLSKITNQIEGISRVTIWNWLKKYGDKK